MSIIAKRVMMVDTAWDELKRLLAREQVSGNISFNVREAITALAEAEVIGVSEEYSPDTWLSNAKKEGAE